MTSFFCKEKGVFYFVNFNTQISIPSFIRELAFLIQSKEEGENGYSLTWLVYFAQLNVKFYV